jgi:D-ala D-ala ligase C-terminus
MHRLLPRLRKLLRNLRTREHALDAAPLAPRPGFWAQAVWRRGLRHGKARRRPSSAFLLADCARDGTRTVRREGRLRISAPAPALLLSCRPDPVGSFPPRASQLGEIVPAGKHGFYSYDAKYIDADGAALHAPADVPPLLAARIRELAIRTFRVLCCEGMARVDFFLSGEQVFVNEANTLPGFTNISMYPRLWEASGLPQSELMDVLIGHALARHKGSRNLAVRRA